MRRVPYKLRTDAWWLDGVITWRAPMCPDRANPSLDRASGGVICDRNTQAKPTVKDHGKPHPDCR